MRTLIKIGLWVIGTLIVLYLLASFFLVRLVSPTVVSTLQSQLAQKLNMPTKLKANVSLSFFPAPSITLKNINFKLGTNQVQSTIGLAHVALKLQPLIHRQIVPSTIKLENANIDLVGIKGQLSSGLQANKKTTRTVSAKKNVKKQPSNTRSQFGLPHLIIKNTQIKWQNKRTKHIMSLSGLTATIAPATNKTNISGQFTLTYDKKIHKMAIQTVLSQPSSQLFKLSNLEVNSSTQAGKKTSTIKLKTTALLNMKESTLKLTDLKGQINRLPFSGNLMSNWQQANNQLTVNAKATLAMANGQLSMGINYRSPAQKAAIALKGQSLNLEKISAAFQMKNTIKGTADLQAMLNTQKYKQDWVSKLQGKGQFQLHNVQFGKTDFDGFIQEGAQRFGKKAAQPRHGATTFSAITGTFTVHDGVFYNDDLALQTKNQQLSATGSGNVNLVTKRINYTLSLMLKQLNNFKLPLDIHGPLDNPKAKPNFEALGKNLLKNAIKKHSFKSLFHNERLKSIF